MTSSANPALRDVAVLTRAVENVFRKIIRMLIGRMSLKKLQEMIQIIFVEEAEAKLQKEAPGRNVALGQIALLTGFDTRTIKNIRKYIALNDSLDQDSRFLDGFMPLFRVFDTWMNDPKFIDSDSGKPKKLKIDGNGATFTELVELSLKYRGLTSKTVLKRLRDIDVVNEDSLLGMVEMKQTDNVFISKGELDMLEVGLAAIGNLAKTIEHNIVNHESGDEKFFQRGSWNYNFDPANLNLVRRKIHKYLTETDAKSRELITSLAETDNLEGQVTAGISMFYFENEFSHKPA